MCRCLSHSQVVTMGEKSLLLYILQTFIATSLSISLPFPNSIGTVAPIKPRPSLPTAVPETLPSIKSLECDEDFLSPLFSSLGATREFSSPIAVKASSRALPVPKIDDLSLSNVKIPEGLVESLPASLKKLFKGPPVIERNLNDYSADVLFPFKGLKNTMKIPKFHQLPTDSKRCDDMCFAPSVAEVSVRDNPFGTPKKCSLPNPSTILASSIRSPPVVPSDPLKRNGCASTIPLVNNGLSSIPSALHNSVVNPGSYPLSYKSRFLPKVRTPDFNFCNRKPNPFTPMINTPNQSYSPNIMLTPPLPISLPCSSQPLIKPTPVPGPPCLSPITMTESPNSFTSAQIPKITPPSPTESSFSPYFIESPLPYKNPSTIPVAYENIRLPNSCKTLPPTDSLCSDNITPKLDSMPVVTIKDIPYSYPNSLPTVIAKTPYQTTPVLPSDVCSSKTQCPPSPVPCEEMPKIRPTPVTLDIPNYKSTAVVDICSSDKTMPYVYPTAGTFVNSPKNIQNINIPNVCTPTDVSYLTSSVPPMPPKDCSRMYQYSNSPTPYINTASSFPISLSSSKIVSSINDVVANITQSLLSSYFSYLKSEPKPVCTSSSPTATYNPKYQESIAVPEQKAVPMRSSLPPVNLSYEKSSTPSICQTTNYSPTECPIIIQLDSIFPSNTPSLISPSPETSLVSLVNYALPFSPSYLPSPTLPFTPSPCYYEPPLVKVSSSKGKKEKDILELMILSELLDDDDNYEWDELDTLLALLAIS